MPSRRLAICYRILNLPQNGRGVIGTGLNRSESRRGARRLRARDQRIAHLANACCTAGFRAGLCRSGSEAAEMIGTIRHPMSALPGEFNESTQHLLILADEEVCEWRGMHGHGSRRNRRLSCGSAGRAVNVWRTSRERLRGGTRAASIGSWLAMEGLLQRHAGGLWERCGLRSAKRFREALPPVGRYDGSHRASNDRPQLSAERSGVTAAAAPTAPARLISAPGGGHCAQSLVAWRAMPSYDGA